MATMMMLAILTVLLLSPCLPSQDEAFRWETGLSEAETLARLKNLPLLVYFRCPP